MRAEDFPSINMTVALAVAKKLGWPEHRVAQVLSKIRVTEACWLWTASQKGNGYGQFNDGKKTWNAHRLVFTLSGRTIPDGLELDHLCRVRHCVNPWHLEPVTRQVNVRRQFDEITHCPQGHPYDEKNTYRWRGLRACRKCRIARANLRRKERS